MIKDGYATKLEAEIKDLRSKVEELGTMIDTLQQALLQLLKKGEG